MKLHIDPTTPKSRLGSILITGLFTDEKGMPEPVLVIRGSEPASRAAVIAYMDMAKVCGYPAHIRDQLQKILADMYAWQGSNGAIIPQSIETMRGLAKELVKSEAKEPVSKKK